MILTSEASKVYALGNNHDGALGLNHLHPSDSPMLIQSLLNINIESVHAGRHSAAVSQEGRLFVWGAVFKNEPLIPAPLELSTVQRIS